MTSETSGKRLTVRLSEDESAAVEDLAARRGMSVNRVFKMMASMVGLFEQNVDWSND